MSTLGMFSTMEDHMNTIAGYHGYIRRVSTFEGCYEYIRGYHGYIRRCTVH